MNKKLALQARAFLDAVAVGEDVNPLDYNELVGSTKAHPLVMDDYPDRPGYYGFPDWPGRQFSTGMSHAAGRYQDQPATWKGIVEQSGLGLSNFRDPDQQDSGNWWLALHDYTRRSHRNLLADLNTDDDAILSGIARYLQPTWASLNPATFARRYREALQQEAAADASAALVVPDLRLPSTDSIAAAQALLERAQTALADAAAHVHDAIVRLKEEP